MKRESRNGTPVELSSLFTEKEFDSKDRRTVTSFTTDADAVSEGSLFICLTEEQQEARQQVSQAVAFGASAVAVKDDIEVHLPASVSLVRVEKPKELAGRIAQALYDFPARKLKMIAITGTSGKTSTSYIVAGMLAESGAPVGLIGTLGVYDGHVLLPNRESTPDAFLLAELLDRMVENGCTHAIVEVSSKALEEERLAGIEFDAVCLTNVRRDHLDVHKTVELYRQTKMKIFQRVKPDALTVCNIDDRVTAAVLHFIETPVFTIGFHPGDAMVTGMRVEQSRSEQTFYIIAGSDAIPVRTKIIGNEHIYNCLTAAALGISWGIDLKTVVRGIERVEHIPGRLERIECGQKFGVFVDNAATPESLAGVLSTLRSVTDGSIYCVLSAPEDNDRSKRPLMGRIAESAADKVVVTVGRKESDASQAVSDLLRGMENPDSGVQKIFRRSDAITWALSNAAADDVVLIVGSDLPPECDPEEVVSDRQFVRHWLYGNQPSLEPFWY